MARLKDKPEFLGTRDGICVYTRWGNYYVRTKSSLSGQRVKTAPEFKKTRENASFLAKASKIASRIYKGLPGKNFQKYRELTGQAMKMLKTGMNEREVINRLLDQ
jgi:hypothetical protein